MLRDREEMAACVGKNDIIYTWVARQFGGESLGQHIFWSPSPVDWSDDTLSISYLPYNSARGSIAVREEYAAGLYKGQKIPCERLWPCVVFELYNISSSADFEAIDKAALQGRLSREQYVTSNIKIEFRSERRTAEFYRIVWQPWANSKQMTSHGHYWFEDAPDTYEELVKESGNSPSYSSYLSGYYKYYDTEIAPYVEQQRKANAGPAG